MVKVKKILNISKYFLNLILTINVISVHDCCSSVTLVFHFMLCVQLTGYMSEIVCKFIVVLKVLQLNIYQMK
jgi:hypothetical protein